MVGTVSDAALFIDVQVFALHSLYAQECYIWLMCLLLLLVYFFKDLFSVIIFV